MKPAETVLVVLMLAAIIFTIILNIIAAGWFAWDHFSR